MTKKHISLLCLLFFINTGSALTVSFTTRLGDIAIELDAEKSPKNVANFLSYYNEGFYDNTLFHRVIKNFVIQGGGLTESLEEKATKSAVVNESSNGLLNVRGTVAMARTSDPHSAKAQFYINLKDNSHLDYDFTNNAWGN